MLMYLDTLHIHFNDYHTDCMSSEEKHMHEEEKSNESPTADLQGSEQDQMTNESTDNTVTSSN